MVHSDEPITPKADHRVIDGEVLGGARASAQQQQQTEKPLKTKSDWSAWLPKTFTQKIWLLIFLMLIGLGVYNYFQTQERDWMIERQNQLQQAVNQLQTQQKQLKTDFSSVEASLETKLKAQQAELDAPKNQPLVSQADLDQLQQKFESYQKSVQEELSSANEKAQQLIQQWLASQKGDTTAPADGSGSKAESPSIDTQALETQIQQMSQQLAELFSFKQSQQEKAAKEVNQPTEPKVNQKDDLKALDALQVQRWILDINTQWMLSGNAKQTQKQLLALEQAISVSELPNKMKLVSRIGADLNNLSTVSVQAMFDWQDALVDLKQRLANLSPNQALLSKGDVSHETPVSEQAIAQEGTVWQKIWDKFSQLFSLRKRETADSLTQVETVLMHETLVQRALLQVERLQWAMQMQSNSLKTQALESLTQFMKDYFPDQSDDITKALAPFQNQTFKSRQPLKLLEVE